MNATVELEQYRSYALAPIARVPTFSPSPAELMPEGAPDTRATLRAVDKGD